MSATFTAKPQDVERVISAVLPHASRDEYLPTVCSVSIELDGNRFLAAATDRYTMAVCWDELDKWQEDAEPVERTEVRVFAKDLKRLFAFVRPNRKIPVTWTVTDESLTVATGAESLSVRTVDTEWINWRKIVGGLLDKRAGATAGATVIGFDWRRIDNFSQSAKVLGDTTLTWHMGAPTDAPFIRIGDRFVGILMPVRLSETPDLDLSEIGIGGPKEIAAVSA